MSYTTQYQIQGYIKRELTPDEARIIKTVIDAVGQWIDRETGRTWEPTAAGTKRVFDGGEPEIFIDGLIDLEAVEALDQYGTVVRTYYDYEYTKYPRNSKTTTSLCLNSGGRWHRRVQITGKWGEVEGVPADIRLAATILASDWLDNSDKLKSESIEGYSRTFAVQDSNPQVEQILASRKRVLL